MLLITRDFNDSREIFPTEFSAPGHLVIHAYFCSVIVDYLDRWYFIFGSPSVTNRRIELQAETCLFGKGHRLDKFW